MTDYHPLIARAVDGLEKSTGEARRSLYERARNALVTQLRGVEPALSESEITKERLALEEAIRKVEAEAARKSRTDPQGKARAEMRERAAGVQPRPPAMPTATPMDGNGQAAASGTLPSRRDRPTPPLPEAARLPRTDARRPESTRPQQRPDGTGTDGPRRPISAARERLLSGRSNGGAQDKGDGGNAGARPNTMAQDGIKGFRDVVGDVHDLGTATAKAAQGARETRDSYGPGSAQPAARTNEVRAPSTYARFEPQLDPEELGSPRPDPQQIRSLEPGYDFEDAIPPSQQYARPQPPRVPDFEQEYVQPGPQRSYRGLITLLAVLFVLLGVAAVISWQWSNITGISHFFIRSGTKQQTQVTQQTPPASQQQPKFDGRVPQDQGAPQVPGVGTPSTQQVPAVAQRVVLYEEDPNDPQGRRYVGSAIWRTETISPGAGLAPELAVRADIEIPDRHITATWSLRRNTDKTLPASHTIEIMFNLPADFAGGGIANVPGILMKQAEQARGTPLAGLAVKVTNGFFLIGLSAVDADVQRNIQLLKERAWFDVPVVYTNGGRAILAMEKGQPGDRAFAEAFAAWEKK